MKRWIMVFLLLWPLQAAGDDAELYDPAPPPDSAFVRVIHAKESAAEITPQLAGKSFGRIAFPAVSDYRAIPAGDRIFVSGGREWPFALAAGRFYSITLGEEAAALQEDAALVNPAKARIYFYNLSDAGQASVIAPDHGNAAIIKDLSAGEAASREVNAVALSLRVKSGEVEVETFTDVVLKRRRGVSIVLAGSESHYRAVMVHNAMAR